MEDVKFSNSDKIKIIEFKIKEAYEGLKDHDLHISKYEMDDDNTRVKTEYVPMLDVLGTIGSLERMLEYLISKEK